MSAPGGQGTYYAQAIYQAQAYLVAERLQFPNSQNVIILLSDGDATATCTTSKSGVCTAGPMIGASTTSGVYPSSVDECHQAVRAAQTAWDAGTTVYAVNYGAEATGCATDTPAISPCQTMLEMATKNYPTSTATGVIRLRRNDGEIAVAEFSPHRGRFDRVVQGENRITLHRACGRLALHDNQAGKNIDGEMAGIDVGFFASSWNLLRNGEVRRKRKYVWTLTRAPEGPPANGDGKAP